MYLTQDLVCKCRLALLLCNYAVSLKSEEERLNQSLSTLGMVDRLPHLLTQGELLLWVTEESAGVS